MTPQALRFGIVGLAGYLVDSAVLYAGLSFGLGHAWGRLLSFLCAVATTWFLNRRYTFSRHTGKLRANFLFKEMVKYLSAMLIGGLLNLITYGYVIQIATPHAALPAFGVAAGSLVGMMANFAAAKYWVYRN